MQVVWHSVNGERLHSVVLGNAGQILAQEAVFVSRYERPPIFCAENYVDVNADEGVGPGECRPSGAGSSYNHVPRPDGLGYYISAPRAF